MELHNAIGHYMAGWCKCGKCETRRTLAISPSTRDHVLGEFDVDRARFEVQRDQGDVSGMLMGWYIRPRSENP